MSNSADTSASGLQRATAFVLDNLFDIATVLAATFVILRHQIKPFDIPTLLSWLLAILALLAVSGLWDRNRRLRRIESLGTETRTFLQTQLSSSVSASDFFTADFDRAEVARQIASASRVYICGLTLARTTRQLMDVLSRRLQAGATIRLSMLDLNRPGLMEVMAARSMGATTADYWAVRLGTVLDVIKAIRVTSVGSLEIGFIPFPISFGLILVDPEEPHGRVYVELYHHRTAESNATFSLSAVKDPHWYRFFCRQWDEAWRVSRVEAVELEHSSAVLTSDAL
ncbi:MAG TPA: hypothetical protein VGB92_26800 [Longimicrobium sp.]